MPQNNLNSGTDSSNSKHSDLVGSSTSIDSNSTINNTSTDNNPTLPINTKKPSIEKKHSTRSIRSPLPKNHVISRQHSTSNTNHHRQYVLLREKANNNTINNNSHSMNPESPQLQPQSSATSLSQQPQTNVIASSKPKPYLRKQPSVKYVFSVDDNEDEIEEDLTREYLEGYNDALRHRMKSINPSAIGHNQLNDKVDPLTERKRELESDVFNNLQQATKQLDDLKKIEVDPNMHPHNNSYEQTAMDSMLDDSQDNLYQDQSMDQEESADVDYNDNASILSNESFTLKERQVAINETHPFGIRIWKPAIYKKDRSVQKEAERDVHQTPGSNIAINYSVTIFNIIWTCTFGLLLFLVCYCLGFITYFFSIFTDPKKNDSIKYAKFYWNLASYLLYPFGKIVLLKTDQNYLDEDANVGSSMDEFARWRDQNQGKLFFSAAYNMNSNNESTTNENISSVPSPMIGNAADQNNVDNVLNNDNDPHSQPRHDSDDEELNVTFYKKRFFGRGTWTIGRVAFYVQYYFILVPIGMIISIITWLSIFCIPMSKVLTIMASHIRRHPLALSFENEETYERQYAANPNNKKNESFLILTYRSFGFHYYKYTVDGTNIFFINLNFLVLFTILDFYLLKEYLGWKSLIADSNVIFGLCLVSIIPLAYFIGQAVASISAQTSMGLGAVINAFFSTIVEIYLYCIALDQSKAKLVEGSLIGSILGGVLLLPGGSMCFGAIRRKTQRYNPASAGVSSTMLLYAIIVMLSPTILYQIYGEYKVKCSPCEIKFGDDCRKCHYYQSSVVIDPLYINYLRPFTIICASSLFLVYCICLLFTLKTHAALIWSNTVNTSSKEKKTETNPISENHSINSFNLNEQSPNVSNTNNNVASQRPSRLSINNTKPSAADILKTSNQVAQTTQPLQIQEQPVEAPAEGGHDAPNWSRTKSTTILLGATLLYAIIAEILVDCVDDVLKSIAINPKFLGLTIFALVPNTTEFVNAFSFAMHGNVALSMEIGSAYALQVCLLQIPIVMLYSVWNFTKYSSESNGLQLLVRNDWVGLPRLSSLLGLQSKSNTISYLDATPVDNPVLGIVSLLDTQKVKDVLNIGIDKIFPLIFPHWDFIATLFGVYMFTYIYTEGKSNYFKGSILIFLYLVLISGFYIALEIDSSSISRSDMFDMFNNQTWTKR